MFINQLRTMIDVFRKSGLRGVWRNGRSHLRRELNAPEVVDISDEFVNWLSFAKAGMLMRGNLYCIGYAIRDLPNNAPILEIGSFCGLSTNLISYYKEKYRVKNALLC